MPFKSEAQRRFLFKFHPSIAKRWAHEYGTPKQLPYHVKGGGKTRRGGLKHALAGFIKSGKLLKFNRGRNKKRFTI